MWSSGLGAGRKAKRMVLQCINGVSSNPVEGRTKIWQLKNLILTLFGLIFRRIYIYIVGKNISTAHTSKKIKSSTSLESFF